MLVDKQTYFEKNCFERKKITLKITLVSMLSWSAFDSAFIVSVISFTYKSEFFMGLEILYLLTNPLSLIFVSSIFLVNMF